MQTRIYFIFNKINISLRKCSRLNHHHQSISSQLFASQNMSNKNKAPPNSRKQKIKEKSHKYTPGTINLQVLGSGAKGAPRSLYLFTDQSRYLFNCGEGTQRLAHEHKARLARLEHIFITQSSWQNIGGLPGLALTIQDAGVQNMNLHGPKSTAELFEAARRFIQLRDLQINLVPCNDGEKFVDNALRMTYVLIYPAKPNQEKNHIVEENSDDETDYYAYENKRRGGERSNSPVCKKPRFDLTNNSIQNEACVCYLIKFHTLPGTLCLEKCVDKGVPPGPLLGKLKAGEDITLPNGNIVLANDVRLPDIPGPVLLVVECPTLDYLDSFVNHPLFRQHQSTAAKDNEFAHLVAHFTPQEVLQHPRYKEWMKEFSPSTQHLILNEENTCLGSEAVHRIQYQLNLIHPKIFPLLENPSATSREPGLISAKTLMNFKFRPLKGLQDDLCISIKPEEYLSEALTAQGVNEELAKMKASLTDNILQQSNEYPRIVFLGTGSCIPNKTRNTSAILLHTGADSCILLDCGEGTFGQLTRFYGANKLPEILKKLKAVYISHLHADHHIGLIGLLREWKKCNESEIYLIAPKQIRGWLSRYNNVFEPILHYIQLVPNSVLMNGNKVPSSLLESLHLTSLETCPVRHCPHSFGVALTQQDGWKLTYSGDTMPCDHLVRIGKNSDILIHEATMEDELKEEAKIKMHCTMSEAIEMGKKMGARFTLLTHFSQRYAKLPRLSDAELPSNVGIAFDNMEVSLQDLPLLHLFQSSLKLIFHEYCEELDNRAMKRFFRKKLEEGEENSLSQKGTKKNTSLS